MSSNSDNATNLADATNALVCVACKTPNASDKKFCLKCGEGLTFECPECETGNPVNSAFCGSCGTDLQQIFRDGEELFEKSIDEARKKASEFELTAAIRVLISAIESPSLHLKCQKTELTGMISQYRERKAELKADAEEKHRKAKFQYEQGEISKAIANLDDIPGPIRSPEADEFLQHLRQEQAESKRLAAEIESLIKKKDLLGALPLVKSLLVIRPNDEKLKHLATDIIKRVISSVERLKKEGKYKEAFGLIQKIGEMGKSSRTSELQQELKEVVWLINYVKRVQVVDKGLVKALEKLVRLTDSAESKKFLAEATNRLKTANANPLKSVSWSPVPKTPLFGIPVTLAPSLNLIEGFESVIAEGRTQSSFLVAAGLAIQGVGQAKITTSMLEQKKSFFSFGGKKSGKVAWGLDFGNSGLKAVKLSADGQNLKLEQATLLDYRSQDANASVSEQRSTMLEALLRFKSKHDIKKEDVLVTNLNPNQVLGRYLSLPNTDAKALKSAMEFEVKLQIPFPLQDVVWSSHVFPHDQNGKKTVLIIATRKKDSQLVEEMFTANGMKLAAVQSESVALYNYFALAAEKSGARLNDAILDIGFNSSTMTFVSDSQIWFRSFGLGTNNFSKSISRALRLNSEQSTEILKDLPKAEEEIVKALMAMSDPYSELVSEVNRSLQGYENENESKHSPSQIFCAGGGVKLHGLLTYLRHDGENLQVG